MTAKEHLSKHGREIAEIREIQRTTNEYLGRLARAMVQLATAQRRTETALANFIRARSDGHSKRKVDLP
jgi:hypothetical protein